MRLKRKLYSDNEKKSNGWNTVGKIATGTAATLGATALTLRAGRKGTFGTGFQNRVGNWYQNAGARMANSGSRAIQGLGRGLGQQGNVARAKASTANLVKSGKVKGMTEQQIYQNRLKKQEGIFNNMVSKQATKPAQ